MTKYATMNPLGSTSPYDLFDNAQNFDNAINSITAAIWQDRLGKARYTWHGIEEMAKAAIAAFGYITMDSFQAGATLTLPNQVLRDTSTGEYYRWDGVFPTGGKIVPAGSTPANSGGISIGAWLSVGDAVLRGQISAPDGAEKYPELQIARWRDEGDIRGWGARSSLPDNTSYIQAAINAVAEVIVPEGVWNYTQLAIPSNTRFHGVSETKSILRIKDGTDQVWHGLVSANAASVDARLATDANVDTLVGPYVTDIVISDLTIDCNSANRPKTYTDREQGTGIELHKVQRAVVERVTVKDAPQHCFNARAGTGSYEKGYDYVAKYPSSMVRFIDCKAYNQLYDDGITTHDSEYIWIDRCETWLTRNYENPSMPAVSNGIEVDDGSRYVWVTDCYSNGGFGGFQAKGHDNTPPAHHVWFRECVAENNHQAYIISAVNSPSTSFDSDYATVHHIYLDKCTAKNTYAFSNSAAFAAEAHYIQLYNCRSVVINDFQVIGKTVDMPNTSTNPFKTIFRNRAYNAHVQFNRLNLRAINDRGIDGQPLISFEANAQNIKFDGLDIDKFVRGSVLFSNAAGVNWDIKDVYLAEGTASYPVVELGGVGGGTLNAEKVLGSGFTAGYLLNGTKVNAVTRPEYSNRMLSGESVFQQVVGCIPATNVGTMVGQNIGHDHIVSIDGGASATRIGRIQTNINSGNVNDNTCVTRFGIAVREAGSATTVTALNVLSNSLSPAVDNKMQFGAPNLRATQVCATNGTVNTSDATRKRGLRNPTLAELAAFAMISRLPSVWQWIAKYEVEGDDARLHSGPTVQACIQIMEDHGLTWSDYSCFCYDEWDDAPATYVLQPATYDQDGNLVTDECLVIDTPAVSAGSVYSLRKDELLWWCLRAQVSQIDSMEKRIAKLEGQ
ncbi:hypothetical protein [Citrobacter sp. Cf140]|uniref:tail fiber/spike domain-containing protein n=1 Tax=Citrobacter sp. Cf140 TaxID=2985083 RepID=UPI0025771CB0|nr:hypothetical protein [Citrobacter sp. Cf140]MDM3096946.1 hypothetical protein [Citrobacter sp. Cf140]